MLGISAKAGKIVSGTDYCLLEMKKGKVKLILIAQNASEKTKKNFVFYAEQYKIPIVVYGELEENSKAIGKKNRAVIGIIDKNLADQIEKVINGGEKIG